MFTYKLVDSYKNEVATLDRNFHWLVTQDTQVVGVNIYRSTGSREYIPLQRTCTLHVGDKFNLIFDNLHSLLDLQTHLEEIKTYKSVREIMDFFGYTINLLARIQNNEPQA